MTISTDADVFAAGLTTPPDFSGGGGELPTAVGLPAGTAGRPVMLSDVSGQINCCGGTAGSWNGPDGSPGGTDIGPAAGLSAVIDSQSHFFLTGVFLGAAGQAVSPPPNLDFSPDALGEDFVTLRPQLGQTFFIGDGVTSNGVTQQFIVPPGAADLRLGVPDALGFGGAPGFYSDNLGQLTATVAVGGPTPPLIVNEVRLTGPSTSPGDQYVDLYNSSGAPLSLDGWSLDWTSGQSSGSAALGPVTLAAGGHYLVSGSGYSLSAAAAPDQTVALSASLDGVGLVEPDGSTVSDSVGYVGSANVWGTGLTAPVYPAGDGSLVAFVRRSANAVPVDTSDNQADFVLVAPDTTASDMPSYGQPAADPAVLGTPSPLDLDSPVQVNAAAQSYLLDRSVAEGTAPNLTCVPPASGAVSATNPATLIIRRTITNVSTSQTITALQLRVTGLSTFGEQSDPVFGDPADPADAAILSNVSWPADPTTATVATTLTSRGPGLNSTSAVALPDQTGSSTPGLIPSQSVNVAIAFHVYQTGRFAIAYNAEDDLTPYVAPATGAIPAGRQPAEPPVAPSLQGQASATGATLNTQSHDITALTTQTKRTITHNIRRRKHRKPEATAKRRRHTTHPRAHTTITHGRR